MRDAILGAAAAVIGRRGLHALKMAGVARKAGIGRATMYKYFADVEDLLHAWHERQLDIHLANLAEIGNRGGSALRRLEAVLETFGTICLHHHGSELAALLHRAPHVSRARQQLRDVVQRLLTEGARGGEVRADVSAVELSAYCLHAVTAATGVKSAQAVKRLVAVTLAGVRSKE